MIEEDSEKTYALNLDVNNFKNCGWNETESSYMNDYEIQIKNGEIMFENAKLNIKEVFENILSDNLFSVAILAASVINVGWSIHNFNIISEEYQNLVNIDKDFEEIKEKFISHKKLLEKLPDGIKDAIDYINRIIKYIKEDYDLLNKHIENIKQKMEKAESTKTNSMIGMGVSIGLGLLGLGGSIISIGKNLFSMGVNTLSTDGNAYALKKNYETYELSNKVISELDKKLKRANEFGNEMNNFINSLIDKLRIKENEIPKFCDFEIIENYF